MQPLPGQMTCCARACCTPLVTELARAFHADLELSPLGVPGDRGDAPHGIVISPVPRPPPGDVA
ncbi:MAG TPA: hypothetical protein VK824_10580 [Planctomycetota bacterium]|nr:hypothetical protein [Planctomycetota bacterium]